MTSASPQGAAATSTLAAVEGAARPTAAEPPRAVAFRRAGACHRAAVRQWAGELGQAAAPLREEGLPEAAHHPVEGSPPAAEPRREVACLRVAARPRGAAWRPEAARLQAGVQLPAEARLPAEALQAPWS